MLSQSRISLFCAAGVLLASAGMAQATTIYSDSLSGSATAVLTGTTPPTDTTGAVWTYRGAAGDDFFADGLTPTTTGGSYSSSTEYLPYNTGANLITAGNIYTVSAVLDPTSGGTGNWFALGFLDGNGLLNGTLTSGPWILLRDNGGTQTFNGPGVGNNYAGGTTSGNVLGGTAEVVLNTSSANWTAQWLYEAPGATSFTSLGTNAYTTNPTTLGGVGFATYQSTPGQIQNFQFTSVATPEPATFGIFGIGIAGLLLLKKRRTA